MSKQNKERLESVLKELRRFKPSSIFSRGAHIRSLAVYRRLYNESITKPEKFWGRIASELYWFKPWRKVLEWKPPFAKWFVGGRTNLSVNCLDRHLTTWRRNKAAIIWEGEPGESRTLTYLQLHREVCKCANVLKGLGVTSGDRVAIYMPMVPELAISMLACARIGATHSVIFGGFSAQAIADRVNDAGVKLIITADGGYRRGNIIPLKQNVDEALALTPTVQHVLVLSRCGTPISMRAGRDISWADAMDAVSDDCLAEPLDAEHPLFILYTSGTTGKPKGIVHTTGGYLTGVYITSKWVFDLKDDDTFWCTADIGWVTGHSYVIYGPLANGATTLMYEGAPNHP